MLFAACVVNLNFERVWYDFSTFDTAIRGESNFLRN